MGERERECVCACACVCVGICMCVCVCTHVQGFLSAVSVAGVFAVPFLLQVYTTYWLKFPVSHY